MLFESINLPLPVLLHAIGLTALGLFMIFEKPQKPGQDRSVLGIATTGLGLSCMSLYCFAHACANGYPCASRPYDSIRTHQPKPVPLCKRTGQNWTRPVSCREGAPHAWEKPGTVSWAIQSPGHMHLRCTWRCRGSLCVPRRHTKRTCPDPVDDKLSRLSSALNPGS